ncbi:alanine racemase [Lutibacter sp.]|uniref:alanine racemase n=1 Tax=Lutibacter sp. TaxID=1925666 RepID=UPI0025C6BFAA|nr:alanine racemase [Lutibacter sp.]MCF6180539.1 alanine racemase [Lutibacter sp.]
MSNHVTILEINLNSLEFNLNYFKKKLESNTKILAVVKAFGYGSSAVEISKFLADKVSYFAVAYLDEGIALRKAGIINPILVLHPVISNFNKIVEYQLEPNIYSFKLLKAFLKDAKKLSLNNYPIHLKFNTGLNRLGFNKQDVAKLIKILELQKTIKVASIFSHIAASEDVKERNFTLQQISIFKTIITEFDKKLSSSPIKHMLNTSGIINYNTEAQFDMVRLGIGLYGFGNDAEETSKLKNVLILKSIISQIHTIQKGDSVGYNRAFKATKTIKSATIPIGHADGISRQLGNKKGYVYVNNKKAPIIGNVCMDMIMIDVTNIECEEGDEVIIYKNQQHIEDLAQKSNTISYELITAISQRVNRVVK